MSVFVYLYLVLGPIRKIWVDNIPVLVLTSVNSYGL
jgi:hypothetical protein